MNTRIKALRKQLQLTQEAFGERCGIKKSSVSTIESGRNPPSNQTILAICKEFHVNEQWLRTGAGEMFVAEAKDRVDELAEQYGLSPEFTKIIRQLIQLPEETQQQLVTMAFKLAGVEEPVSDAQRDADLLRAEADAVEQEGEKSLASPLENDA